VVPLKQEKGAGQQFKQMQGMGAGGQKKHIDKNMDAEHCNTTEN
jgi:hypothetical protein